MTSAAIYLRISLDRTGDELGVDRQRKACHHIAKERGWTIAGEYVDNSKSAYAKNVHRPRYEQLVKDFHAGQFTALICWDLDRLTRQPRQLEDWIDAAEERALTIVTVDGATDLGTETGRQFARIKAAIARGEIEHKSKRQKARNDQRAEAGTPFMGRRAFGYQTGGRDINQPEADEYRRAVDAILDGAPLRAVVRSMNDRGVRTAAGNTWARRQLKQVLTNPRHAGLRVHRGQIVGEGIWPAIIDVDTHRALVAILTDPSRTPKGRPHSYLLSGVAVCAARNADGKLCGGRLYGRIERRGTIYYCPQAPHMGRKTAPVDAYVEKHIIARLRRPDAAELFAPPDNTDRVKALQEREKRLRALLNGLGEAYAAEAIDMEQLTSGSKRLRDELAQIATELPALIGASALTPLLTAVDPVAVWKSCSTHAKRDVVDAFVTVTVHPPGRGARTFDPATVIVEPRRNTL